MSLIMFAVVLLTGCAVVQMSSRDPGTLVVLTRIANFTYAANDVFPSETTTTVTDKASWQTLWAQMVKNQSPAPAAPQVDFSSAVVLVAAAGTRSSGGYTITVTGATQHSAGTVVDVTITTPGMGCAVTAALTSPVDIVAMPVTVASVTFNITHKTQSCS